MLIIKLHTCSHCILPPYYESKRRKEKQKYNTMSKRGKVQGNIVVYWSDWTGEERGKKGATSRHKRCSSHHRVLNGASALLGGRLM